MSAHAKSARPRTPWLALLLLIVAPAAFLATVDWSQAINGNILDLLPTEEESAETIAARELIAQQITYPVFLRAQADAPADALRTAFREAAQQPGFGDPFILGDPSYQRELLDVITRHREALFAADWLRDQGRAAQQPDLLAGSVVERLDNFLDDPRAMLYSNEIPADPLLLVPHALDQLPDAPPTADDELITWIPVTVDPITAEGQATVEQSLAALEAAMAAQFSDYQQQSSGVYRIAQISEERTRANVSRLNTIMAVAILGLLLIIAGRPGFLILTAAPVLVAALWSVAAGLLVFGHIHVIALVIGSVVLGLAVDYSVHLAAQRDPGENLLTTWRRVRLPLATSALSTCFGFSFLLLSPMGALKQVGVIAPAGLLAALLAVRWLLPWLEPLAGQYRIRPAMEKTGPAAKPRSVAVLATIAWLIAVFAIARSERFEDTIYAFQPPIGDVLSEYRDLTASLNHDDSGRQMYVVAGNPTELLERLKRLRTSTLSPNLTDVILPPGNEEWQNFASQSEGFITALQLKFNEAGYDSEAFSPFFEKWNNAGEWNQPEAVNAAMAELAKHLHGPSSALLLTDGQVWVSVFEMSKWNPMRPVVPSIAKGLQPHTHDVARTAEINYALKRARLGITRSAQAGLIAICLCVLALYRRRAFRALCVPVWAVTLGIAVTLLLGNPLGLLAIIGAILAFCLALDYGAFAVSARNHTPVSIRISALTTFTAFFILSFCSLPAVAQLGQVVAAAVFFGWLAAELMCLPSPNVSRQDSA